MKNLPTFEEFITEMAFPSNAIKNKLWFHGTSIDNIDKILNDKYLKPSESVTKRTKRAMAPVYGKVYLTADVQEAIRYAYFRSKIGVPAYLIIIDGNSLKDVQPDEDIIADLLQTEDTIKGYEWLLRLAKNVDEKLYKKFQTLGDYDYSVALAKKIVKHITNDQKIELINKGLKLAHDGEIPIKEIWELPPVNDRTINYNKNIIDYKTNGKKIL